MRESLFSALWYRVADRHPQLHADVSIRRQQVRDQAWYVLTSAADGRHYRVNAQAWRLVGRCDGRHSVRDIWDALLEEHRDEAPTQDEMIRTLAGLERQGLLYYDAAPDAAILQRRHDERRRRGFVNPFALRVSLGDPSPWLRRIERLAPLLFNPWTFWAWAIAVLVAFGVAASERTALHAHAVAWMTTPRYLALCFVAYPLLKVLHELGHALAVRRWGGAVHDYGFSLFVLVPAAWVDASASTAFQHRRHRMAVGAAGILVELAVAAAALAVFLNVEPGLVRDFAFVTLFLASISTLLFNGNPLLPFDGYYVLCDAFDLPNLASRSRAWWTQRLQGVAGYATAVPIVPARGERKWLAAYAPLSMAYRFAIAGATVLWLGHKSFVLGTIATAVFAVLLVIQPARSILARLRELPLGAPRRRAISIVAGGTALVLVLLFTIPFPYHTVAAAVVWPPEQSRIRPATEGFVAELPVADGASVAAGDLVLRLEDPALLAQRERLERRLDRLRSSGYASMLADPLRAENAALELAAAQEELERVEHRIAALAVRAPVAGVLAMPRQQDLHGTLVHEGDTIGYVMAAGDVVVRAAVPEYEAAMVRDATLRAEVRLAGGATRPHAAELVRDIPAATRQLPSAALGDKGGGGFVTDPADREGLRSLDPVILVDLRIADLDGARAGSRAWVRFDHEAQPLAQRWLRRSRQLFLRSFNPEA